MGEAEDKIEGNGGYSRVAQLRGEITRKREILSEELDELRRRRTSSAGDWYIFRRATLFESTRAGRKHVPVPLRISRDAAFGLLAFRPERPGSTSPGSSAAVLGAA